MPQRLLGAIGQGYQQVQLKLGALPSSHYGLATELRAQLDNLIGKRAFAATPWDQLQHIPRYLKAMAARVCCHGPHRRSRLEPGGPASKLREP